MGATPLTTKRRFPRRRFKRKMGFLTNGEYWMGTGDEIGEGGISLFTHQEYEIGSEAVVSFQIPDGSFVAVRVEVRNVRQINLDRFLIGCTFKNLKFDHKKEIRSYVSTHSEMVQ